MSSIKAYHAPLLVTQIEMWDLAALEPKAKGIPQYYCITRDGMVQFYPALDPSKVRVLLAEGVI